MDSNVVIAISREYGSGGHSIGKKLAEMLEIPFYDRESIEQTAKEEPFLTESNCEWLVKNNLKPNTLIGSAFSPSIILGDVDSQKFLKESNVIWKLAQEGACVIVGRCVDFVLQNRPHTYRFFLTSDMKRRLSHIRRYPELYGPAQKREAKDILRMDKKRATYYNYYTGQIWGNASNYDMCINTGKLGPQTPHVILEFIRSSEQIANYVNEDIEKQDCKNGVL